MLERAPWDLLPYFVAPAYSLTVVTQTPAQLLKADNTRVMVIFTLGGTGGVGNQASVGNSPKQAFYDVANSRINGIILGVQPVILTLWEHGPIVCSEWWGASNSSMGVFVNATSQSVNAWPGDRASLPPLFDSVDSGPRRPPQRITRAPGVGGRLGILDYWHSLLRRMMGR